MISPARFPLVACAVLIGAFLAGCGKKETAAAKAPPVDPATAPIKSSGGTHAVIETDKGVIEFELLDADQPRAAENFRLLAKRGYYNGLTFHRIVKGFMLQGGDPQGTGAGGESAWGGKFADEINTRSPLYLAGYLRGMVAMANSGPNTNTSQFFIMHKTYPLPPNYVLFGKVTKGMEVVDALAETPTTRNFMGEQSTPTTPIVMKKVTIR
jgi:cyclophilin family peptidyl-prolyl cis-trans isomerase